MHCELTSQKSKFGTADDLVAMVTEKFRTRNVYEIAARAGLKIIYRRWFPVTAGELDWRAKTICVNEAAEIDGETIIAHELGHYFRREFAAPGGAADEESFCDEFAARLLRNE
jgi:hypothetical protein